MHELCFLGMDIFEETREVNHFFTMLCTDGMTENELRAYNLGVDNALSALASIIDENNSMLIVHINELDTPIELTIDELYEYSKTM